MAGKKANEKTTIDVNGKKYSYTGRIFAKGKTDEELSAMIKEKMGVKTEAEINAIADFLKSKVSKGGGSLGKYRKMTEEELRKLITDLTAIADEKKNTETPIMEALKVLKGAGVSVKELRKRYIAALK